MAKNLDRIHSRWPDKPVFVGQWGYGAPERVRDPATVQTYLRGFMALLRERPYVVGASFWVFADYRSRWPYPTTEVDGYRHFGVVDRDRQPRATYENLRAEFSPVVIREVTSAAARIQCRGDFPSYEVRDYEIRWQLLDANRQPLYKSSQKLAAMKPGEERTVELRSPAAQPPNAVWLKVEVVRPTGYVAADKTITLSK